MDETRLHGLLPAVLLLAGCGGGDAASEAVGNHGNEAARAAARAPAPAAPTEVAARPAAPAPFSSPCLAQDGKPLGVPPLHALGTEPFWSARIEGRCVTYSHPEDPKGTRVWTRYTPVSGGGIWSGALGGRRFELRASPRPGCSDGMSDKSYPIAVELIVAGERRSGCAEPL